MRRWATALRQPHMIPPIQDRDLPRARLPGAPPRLQHGVPVAKSRRIPPALTSSLLPSFPFLEKPKTGEPPSPPAAQQPRKLTVRSPHYLTKRVRWISNLTNKRCWCSSLPEEEGGRSAGTPSKESTGRFGILLTRRTIVSSLYPMTGQIPMVLVPPLGRRYPPRAGNGVGRVDHRCATYEETSRRRRDCTPTGSEPACQNNRGRSHCNKE